MIYAYDDYMQIPTVDLYDTQMMAMAVNAAKDMYDRGQQQIKDFTTQYGDFMSPFSKDMERYGEMVGGVRNIIDDAYAHGIDLTKSPEGRAILSRAINSINPAEFNRMRANAKAGYAYLDAMQKLQSAGKYDPEMEDFMLQQAGIGPFSNFSSANGNMWTRTSPIQAASLLDLTYDSYKGRSARSLTANDFANDPRLANYAYDPRYQYTGYLDSDLMKVAPGASLALQGDPRAAFYREKSRQKLLANGIPVTEENIEAQFQRDIADANAWALIDPTKKADDFALLQEKERQAIRAENRAAARDARNNSQKNSSGGSSLEKESLSDAQYQLMRGTANILKNTMIGRAAGVSTYADFDPEKMSGLLYPAQAEIADKYYTKAISGGGDISVKRTKNNNMFQLNPSTGKLEPNTDFSRINVGDYSVTSVSPFYPALKKTERQALSNANRQFTNYLSMDYTPAKFAQWTHKSTVSGDNSMINISNDADAISRIYSIDEIALRSAGVNRPAADLNWGVDQTNGIRKAAQKNGSSLYMKSTGRMVPHLANDGSVHMYQLIDIYKSSGSGTKQKFTKMDNIGTVGYDMGITTYSNPNFGINGDMSNNLYFDENTDADVRWSGDQNVLHWEHVGAPQMDATIAYPQLPLAPWQQ